jgi:SAM-dependent methyltransferase
MLDGSLLLSLCPASSSRMIEIQSVMARRAMELMSLPANQPAHILDIGCGSGLSGEVLSEAGFSWTGIDIAPAMLGVAVKREVEGDLLCADIGQGLFFRPNSFDGAISISVIQWLCNADKKEHVPQVRLRKFFQSLYNCLKRGARSVEKQRRPLLQLQVDGDFQKVRAVLTLPFLHPFVPAVAIGCVLLHMLPFAQCRLPVLPRVPCADDDDHRGVDEMRFLWRIGRRLPEFHESEKVNTPRTEQAASLRFPLSPEEWCCV